MRTGVAGKPGGFCDVSLARVRRCAPSGRGEVRRRPMALRLRRGAKPFPVRTGVPGKPGSFKTPIFFSEEKKMRLLMV